MPPFINMSLCKDADFERLLSGDIIENKEDGDPNKFTDGIRWAGIGTRYFLTVGIPKMVDPGTAIALSKTGNQGIRPLKHWSD